jgi:HEAT repeat protein
MRSALLSLALVLSAAAQPPAKPKDVRDAARQGSSALPKLAEYLKDPLRDVRVEAVKQIVAIGTARSLDPLIAATHDGDPEIQVRAVDGLVNFYLPGYARTGLSGSIRKVGTDIKGKFTDTNGQIIDSYIIVRPEVTEAIANLVKNGASLDVRTSAARASGVLRGKVAVPALVWACASKNSDLIYESLIALQKIRDESAGPQVAFLLHDFDLKVQETAIDTMGVLRNLAAIPALKEVLDRTREPRIKRAALESLSMLPDRTNQSVYLHYLNDKDEKLRGSAAEGLGRLKDPANMQAVQRAWDSESKTGPRLSDAFALVLLGKTDRSEFSPVQFLINNLGSAAYSGVAEPFLTELARDPRVRNELYAPMQAGSKAEKLGLARVLSVSGDRDSIPELKKLGNDPDPEVAKAALTAVQNLQSHM